MLAPTYRPRAAYDIESAVLYIATILDSPQAARSWYESLVAKVELLCEFPDIGRILDDDRLLARGMRTHLVGSYRLFFSYDEDELVVWRVIHASQDIDDYALVDLAN